MHSTGAGRLFLTNIVRPSNCRSVVLAGRRKLIDIRRNQMMGNDVLHHAEPIDRQCGKNFAFVRN